MSEVKAHFYLNINSGYKLAQMNGQSESILHTEDLPQKGSSFHITGLIFRSRQPVLFVDQALFDVEILEHGGLLLGNRRKA